MKCEILGKYRINHITNKSIFFGVVCLELIKLQTGLLILIKQLSFLFVFLIIYKAQVEKRQQSVILTEWARG